MNWRIRRPNLGSEERPNRKRNSGFRTMGFLAWCDSSWLCSIAKVVHVLCPDGSCDDARHPEVTLGSLREFVSILGVHPGQAATERSNRSENNGRLRVRSEGELSCKSSKRVQGGEPN